MRARLIPAHDGTGRRADRGSAMILTVMFVAMVTGLATIGTALAVTDLRSAGHARQAGTALAAAEAGVAQAVAYVRANGTRSLACYPQCTANPWNPTNPVAAEVPAGGRWQAHIAPISVGNGADGDRYVVQSTGTGADAARRTVEVELVVTPIDLPKAVVARTINLGGTVQLQQISLFSAGCVYKRDKIRSPADGTLDLAYGAPVGVHSAQIITESQGSGQHCPNTAKPVHGAGAGDGTSAQACNPAYPYDQDRLGGSLAGQPDCAQAAAHPAYRPRDLDGDGRLDVDGSFVRDEAALFRPFGITRPALTEAEIDRLRSVAQAQGNYHTTTTGWAVPSGADAHAVLFFDLAGGTVNLDPLGRSLWSRPRLDATSAMCRDSSLFVLVVGGNARINAGTRLAASLYLASTAPHGRLEKANGTADHIGMLYADTIDMTGDFTVGLDTCYVANPSPALTDVVTGSYRELDR